MRCLKMAYFCQLWQPFLFTSLNNPPNNKERLSFAASQIKTNVQFSTCSKVVLKSFESAMESLYDYDHSLASLYSNALSGEEVVIEPVVKTF